MASLRIIPRRMRFRDTVAPVAAIAGVRVKPTRRGQGYSRALMEAALDYMRRQGYAVSLLFGIPGFYHRFGYANVLVSKSDAWVKTAAAESLKAGLAVREAKPSDGEALLAIYDAANTGRTGTFERRASAFSPWLDDDEEWWQKERRVLVAEDAGTPVAYALGDWEWRHESEWHLRPYEIGALPERENDGVGSVIGALAAEAAARREKWLTLEAPPDSSLLGVLKPVGFTQEIEYTNNQGGMGRIMDLGALAAALRDTVTTGLRAMGTEGRVGRVELVCDGERAAIDAGAGRRLAIELPQQYLLQLLMGYRSIVELSVDFPACVADEDVAIVDALFPAGSPYMWRLDHF